MRAGAGALPWRAMRARSVGLVGLVMGLGAVLSGCSSPPSRVAPAPLPEVRYEAPAPGMTWDAGHWHWDETRAASDGSQGDWVWLPGHWE
jgi:hypothetical protein